MMYGASLTLLCMFLNTIYARTVATALEPLRRAPSSVKRSASVRHSRVNINEGERRLSELCDKYKAIMRCKYKLSQEDGKKYLATKHGTNGVTVEAQFCVAGERERYEVYRNQPNALVDLPDKAYLLSPDTMVDVRLTAERQQNKFPSQSRERMDAEIEQPSEALLSFKEEQQKLHSPVLRRLTGDVYDVFETGSNSWIFQDFIVYERIKGVTVAEHTQVLARNVVTYLDENLDSILHTIYKCRSETLRKRKARELVAMVTRNLLPVFHLLYSVLLFTKIMFKSHLRHCDYHPSNIMIKYQEDVVIDRRLQRALKESRGYLPKFIVIQATHVSSPTLYAIVCVFKEEQYENNDIPFTSLVQSLLKDGARLYLYEPCNFKIIDVSAVIMLPGDRPVVRPCSAHHPRRFSDIIELARLFKIYRKLKRHVAEALRPAFRIPFGFGTSTELYGLNQIVEHLGVISRITVYDEWAKILSDAHSPRPQKHPGLLEFPRRTPFSSSAPPSPRENTSPVSSYTSLDEYNAILKAISIVAEQIAVLETSLQNSRATV